MPDFEPNFLRKTYRITLPAKVIIGGKEYKVVDWSFEGFGIKKSPEDVFDKGSEHTITFVLPFLGFEVSFKAKAKLNWQSDDRAGFEFTLIPDEAKQVIRQYVEAYVEGRLNKVGDALSFPEITTVPPETEVPLTEEEEKRLNRKLFLAILIYGALFAVLIFFIYVAFLSSHKVYSIEAFYSSTLIKVSAPERGLLKEVYVKTGSTVHKGQKLFLLESFELKRQISLILSKKKDIEGKVLTLKRERKRHRARIDELLGKLESLKKELNILRKKLKDISVAYEKGYISRDEIDSLRVRIYGINSTIRAIKAEIEERRKLIQIINREIANIRMSAYDVAGITTKTYDNVLIKPNGYELIILSPTAGYVVSVYRNSGEIVPRHEVILSIEDRKEKGYVVGRFKKKEAIFISVGDKARVFFPAINVTVEGKVIGIGKVALFGGETGSETEEYTLIDVPVKIELNKVPKGLHHGMKAEVEVETKNYKPFIFRYMSKLLK